MQRPALRPTLAFNAALSAACGLLMAIAPGTVAGWLGVEGTGWIRLAGLVLLSHTLLLALLVPRLGPRPSAQLNLAAIAPYPPLVVALVAVGIIDRPLGQAIALIDAAVVAGIAVALFMGLRTPAVQGQPAHA